MGIFDRWTNKSQQEQLSDVQAKGAAVRSSKKGEEKKKKSEKGDVTPAEVSATVPAKAKQQILLRPVVSEKSAHAEATGTYTFVVDKNANKTTIARAVLAEYGVKPRAVRIVHMDGKSVRFGKTFGKRSDWKKAFVTLPKGASISVHTGV